MPSSPPLSPFNYLDYRKFLRDFYEQKKTLNRGYSYRLFCRKAGINSPGYFSDVIAGRRNLSKAYVARFAQALDLDERECAFFELLVAFTQAKNGKAKQSIYETMVKALPLKTQRLRRSQLDYFSKWYHVAVRETLSILDVKEDYEALASQLRPAITPAQAKSAIKVLSDLDLVERDGDGRWKAKHVSIVAKGDENESLLYRAYRKEMLARAAEAMETVPADLQNNSCITLSVSPAGMERILAHIEDFHRRVLETVQSDKGEDRVVQLNMQMFPLTQIEDRHAPIPA